MIRAYYPAAYYPAAYYSAVVTFLSNHLYLLYVCHVPIIFANCISKNVPLFWTSCSNNRLNIYCLKMDVKSSVLRFIVHINEFNDVFSLLLDVTLVRFALVHSRSCCLSPDVVLSLLSDVFFFVSFNGCLVLHYMPYSFSFCLVLQISFTFSFTKCFVLFFLLDLLFSFSKYIFPFIYLFVFFH